MLRIVPPFLKVLLVQVETASYQLQQYNLQFFMPTVFRQVIGKLKVDDRITKPAEFNQVSIHIQNDIGIWYYFVKSSYNVSKYEQFIDKM